MCITNTNIFAYIQYLLPNCSSTCLPSQRENANVNGQDTGEPTAGVKEMHDERKPEKTRK